MDQRFERQRPAKSWARHVDMFASNLAALDKEYRLDWSYVSNPTTALELAAVRHFSMASEGEMVGLPKETVIDFLDNGLRLATALLVSVTGTATDYRLNLYGEEMDFGVSVKYLGPENVRRGIARFLGHLCFIFDAVEESKVVQSIDWSEEFGEDTALPVEILRSQRADPATVEEAIEYAERRASKTRGDGSYFTQTLVPPLRIYQAVNDDDYDRYKKACQEAASQYYDFWWVKDNLSNLGDGLALEAIAAMSYGFKVRNWPAVDSEVTPAWIAQGEFVRPRSST